jgi:2-polyprenyl-6-methoxyphenol hydroxylase-like FAD-dependent oxidoreductase
LRRWPAISCTGLPSSTHAKTIPGYGRQVFHASVHALLERSSDDQLIRGDLFDLEPIDRFAFGRVVLIGDAAHAMTPNMGQGACQAIEDAFVLMQELQKSGPETAFQRFEQRRLPRTRWIVNGSRKLGKLAQAENTLMIALRNGLLRRVPEKFRLKQMEKLLKTDF